MDISEELVMALFDDEIKDKAAQMFKSDFQYNGNIDRMPVEKFDISFRLHKPKSKYVNLEFLATSQIGKYFQPIGFYESDASVWIMNEHVETYESLFHNKQIFEKPKFADIKTNAVIAAFSMRTITHVLDVFEEFEKYGWEPKLKNGIEIPPLMRYDKRYVCNGYKCELLFSENGYPQFYLDDEYGLDETVGAYIQSDDGRLKIHPTLPFKNLFDMLSNLGLLTAFNKI